MPTNGVSTITVPSNEADVIRAQKTRAKLFQIESPPVFILFIGIHIVLAIFAAQFPVIGRIHHVALLLILLWVALSDVPIQYTAFAAAYVTSIEVWWRITNGSFYWETGKYLVIVLFIIAMLRRRTAHLPRISLYYLVSLLPGTLLTLFGDDIQIAKDNISFNLSGPLALFVSVWFFSNIKFSIPQLKTFFFMLALPGAATAANALYAIVTTPNIAWVNDSNVVTSGGFGPNQVSATLGLSAFGIWILLTFFQLRNSIRLVLIVLGLWFVAQAALTFSRGGIYTFGIALAVGLLVSARKKINIRRLFITSIFFLVITLVFFPALDSFTGYALGRRFSDLGTTGRDQIVSDDLLIFIQNPIFGIGIGNASDLRTGIDSELATIEAHTEYSRLLAEHGIMGICAIIALLTISISTLRETIKRPRERSVKASMYTWAAVFMAQSAMRIVAPSLVFGFSAADWVDDTEAEA